MTEDWRDRASCLAADDPELFFPVGISSEAQDQADEAKAICDHCPVIGPCLQWALDSRVKDGIAGGLTPDERRLHHRRELKAAAKQRHQGQAYPRTGRVAPALHMRRRAS